MPELPSGTVTFLFTDIEGSTRLLKQLRERYVDVLADHQRILRAAFGANGGQEIDTQGDSFFVAFRRAKDAAAAAVAAQRALASHQWPEGIELRVRMGIHTGEPEVGEERYVGLGVHRAARICAVGHGGQVLLSQTARDLLRDELIADVGLQDLGEVRLKDLDEPERIYQLVVSGLAADFPPLRTSEQAETPFAGREGELAEAARAAVAGRPYLRRRGVLLAALTGVVAAAVSIPIFALGRGSSGESPSTLVSGNAVAVIDPKTSKVVEAVPVGARPGAIVFGSGSLWVANLDDRTVSRIDPTTRRVVRTIPTEQPPTALAAAPGAVWVVSARVDAGLVRRIDPSFDAVVKTIRIRGSFWNGSRAGAAADAGAVWAVVGGIGPVSRIDPERNVVAAQLDAGISPSSMAVGAGAVWVADSFGNTVSRIDPTNVVTTIPVGHRPSAVAVGAGAVWVADIGDDAVVRIDPATGAVKTTIPVGHSPAGVAVGADFVWVTNSGDGTVSRIDPETNEVRGTIPVGGSPQGVTVAAGRVWVSVQPSAAATEVESAKAGGILRVNVEDKSAVDFADPALAYNFLAWQLEYATCAKLLNYPDEPPPAGSQLEPEVAASLPARSADGRTYTFKIRKGFRFSPPSNEPVTAGTFKYTIERALSPRMRSPARAFASDIVGVKAYEARKASHIAGVVASGTTLTIRLTKPAPNFLARISMPLFCSVPTDTPIDPNGVRAVAAAGPYYVSSYTPGQQIVLERNPSYVGGRPHHLEEIDVTMGVRKAQGLKQIEAGTADYAADGIPLEAAARLRARYGPGSPAARAGRQQFFVNALPFVDYLAFNTSRPLFRDPKLRQAVNYAIDRRALTRLLPGDFGTTQPTDQYLPPGFPGFRDVQIYPFTRDLATARRLAGGRHGKAVLYISTFLPTRERAQIVKANLKAIGIDVEIKEFRNDVKQRRVGTRGEPFDMTLDGWIADYQDPADFLNVLFDGTKIRATGNVNFAYFDDPVYNHRLKQAARLSGPQRYLTYGELDIDLARNAAPWAAISAETQLEFFSARIGCQVYQPIFSGTDLAALCLRR